MSLGQIVEQWVKEAGGRYYFKHAVVCHCDGEDLYIITDKPGLLIGYHGELINKYTEILKDNGYTQNIRLIDTAVGFVKVI